MHILRGVRQQQDEPGRFSICSRQAAVVRWGWFYLRLLAASVLHFIFVFVLAILGAFKWAVFWLGGILCVITWYHLDHQLWTPQNLTIPVITATWILGLLAEPLMELLNKTMPWHKLLVPEPADESTENSSEISQQ
ncbi:hypothetical protein KRP37_23270 [Salmonella enterica subsp. enterica serovar Indiana]|nr:hypothetical protein [Salmonella enterica subsp. enterica serovar Indiana]MCQ3378210.1 hypothetical protein [Salmonella enterica subsp. enterica serovar Indiana]